jgi:peptidoglycan/xylan/chitin deacetylase (PgdA/CDA1 family)
MPDNRGYRCNLIVIYDNYGFSTPIEYTFALIFSIYGIDCPIICLAELERGDFDLAGRLVISYGDIKPELKSKKQIHIYASGFFGKNYLKPDSLPSIPLRKYNGLPVIYQGCGDYEAWVRKSEGLIETNIDIIASSFFMLSRYEEVVLDVKDEHDRFPASAGLAYEGNFLNRPVVNEYIELLWSWIYSLKPDLERKPLWPENKEFTVCLTHDVDTLQMYKFPLMARAALDRLKLFLMPNTKEKTKPISPQAEIRLSLLRRIGVKDVFYLMSDWTKVMLKLKKDPYDTFDYMLDLEQKYGFRSSFYFMAGGDSSFDNRYAIAEPRVKKLVKQIEARGDEIGLHGSYNSYDNSEQMAQEKAKLDNIAAGKDYGCRQHYLRWKVPNTWRFQEQAGLLYDTTLSFADHAGFRCGICLPFKPFDITENRELDIWELPLIVQEGTLKGANYQNLSPGEAYKEMVELIQAVKKCHGVFVLLWHNSSFDSLGGWAGWKEVYEKVMKYISEQNAWVTDGKEIVLWWKQRASMASNKNLID